MKPSVDRIVVQALTAKDAEDVARRAWEAGGFRMVRVLHVFSGSPRATSRFPRWVVEAEVEVIR